MMSKPPPKKLVLFAVLVMLPVSSVGENCGIFNCDAGQYCCTDPLTHTIKSCYDSYQDDSCVFFPLPNIALSIGAIIGIGIASFAVVVGLIIACCCYCCASARRNAVPPANHVVTTTAVVSQYPYATPTQAPYNPNQQAQQGAAVPGYVNPGYGNPPSYDHSAYKDTRPLI